MNKMAKNYINVKVNISEGQRKKLKSALENNADKISIQLNHNDLSGEDILALTRRQVNKLAKALNEGKGARITMSPTQLKHNLMVEGGFLGMLAGLAARALPFIATAAKTVLPHLGIGAMSGLANSGIQKLLGSGLYLKKGGCVCRIETDGKGLYLAPADGSGLKLFGNGLYLSRDGNVVDGKGLLLGPNSPFKHIPILGMLL